MNKNIINKEVEISVSMSKQVDDKTWIRCSYSKRVGITKQIAPDELEAIELELWDEAHDKVIEEVKRY